MITEFLYHPISKESLKNCLEFWTLESIDFEGQVKLHKKMIYNDYEDFHQQQKICQHNCFRGLATDFLFVF